MFVRAANSDRDMFLAAEEVDTLIHPYTGQAGALVV